jgi:hypothetical protein
MSKRTIDHGETLAHDMHGQPLHYVHEVSVPRDHKGPAGYRYRSGWVDAEGQKWSLYTRTRPAVRTYHSDALGAVTIPEDDECTNQNHGYFISNGVPCDCAVR